jgi:hypothetical protein
MPYLHTMLESREAGDVTLKGNDLTVHQEAFGFLRLECGDQFRVSVVQPFLIARQQLNVGPATQRQAAFPVKLGLK